LPHGLAHAAVCMVNICDISASWEHEPDLHHSTFEVSVMFDFTRPSSHLPANDEDNIGDDDQPLPAVDVTQLAVLYKTPLAARCSRGILGPYQSLSGGPGQSKAGDQPARVPQVVEFRGDDRVCC
jgi:hypothetical protein